MPDVQVPVYSHLIYDVLPGQFTSVDRPDIPREVAPLISALNGLFERVTAANLAEKASWDSLAEVAE